MTGVTDRPSGRHTRLISPSTGGSHDGLDAVTGGIGLVGVESMLCSTSRSAGRARCQVLIFAIAHDDGAAEFADDDAGPGTYGW
jgi:hypothetical protein